MRLPILLVGLAALTAAACTPVRVLTTKPQIPVEVSVNAPSGAYALDKDHAFVLFKVSHFGFSNYIGRFDEFDAQLDFNAADPSLSRLEVTLETGSVNTGNAKLEDMLRDEKMFSSDAFPQAKFVSTRIERLSNNTGLIHGDLTIKDRTLPARLDVVFNGVDDNPFTGNPTLGFSAKAYLKRSEWGLGQWLPAVSNEVALEIEAEFFKAD